MKYFISTKFHNYSKQKKFLGLKIGNPEPIIDLISIGIVSDDNRVYYAISNQFNLDDAWNHYQLDSDSDKEYPIRDTVLFQIFSELDYVHRPLPFTKGNLKKLIELYGRSKKQIAEEIIDFCNPVKIGDDGRCKCTCGTPCPNGRIGSQERCSREELLSVNTPEFYVYNCEYDWVVFYKIFGDTIMDLPEEFPLYCKDIKQIFEYRIELLSQNSTEKDKMEKKYTESSDYPVDDNEHSALSNAHWNKNLYKFLFKDSI